MSKLDFQFEWIEPQASRGAELRATWARFQINVDDTPITRIVAESSQSVRPGIYLPLYPVAEWLATNWWFLTSEFENPNRTAINDFEIRHDLRHGAEGFALPSLRVVPLGPRIYLEWHPLDLPAQRVSFTERGSAYVDAGQFEVDVSNFIGTVVKRLEEQGISGTLLSDEWKAVTETTMDEQDFCKASAALGIDPYAASEEKSRQIITVGDSLPRSITQDFFATADQSRLQQQSSELLGALERSGANQANLVSLKELKGTLGSVTPPQSAHPWDKGYYYADKLREQLQLNGTPLNSLEALSSGLRIDVDQLRRALLTESVSRRTFDALVNVNAAGSPGFAITHRHEATARFALCRALFEYLSKPTNQPALVTTARTDQQKLNRAFAAQFLVPTSALRHMITSSYVDSEQIDELAQTFGVSSWVVQHQIENHRIARIVVE